MSQHAFRIPVLLALAAVALVACAAPGDPADPSKPALGRPTRSEPAAEPVPSASAAPVTGEVPSEILTAVLEDAAERASVTPSEVEVLTAEAVTWSDGSLDCPEPDMMYTQALVDGYHVIVEAAGEKLDYRLTADGTFRLCETPATGG